MYKRYELMRAFTIILVFSTTLYIFYRPVKIALIPYEDNTTNVSVLYSYENLDQQLCKANINWTVKSSLDPSTARKCPENENIVSIAVLGRTGNLMWAYASVLAVAQQTGLRPYIPSCLRENLKDIFENLTIPTFEEIIHCPVKIDTFVKLIDDWKVNNQQSIILPRYLILPKEVLPWIPNIFQEFTMKKKFRDFAHQTLRNFVKQVPVNNYTFVGVHVRRTDYSSYLKRKYGEDLASPQFFLRAMTYFNEKYNNALFIIVSDDPQWCIQQFAMLKNVFVVTDNLHARDGPALDLAVMVACNHTIYDYGTFGEWGAILAGGETVVYDMIQNSKEGSMQYKENWHLIS